MPILHDTAEHSFPSHRIFLTSSMAARFTAVPAVETTWQSSVPAYNTELRRYMSSIVLRPSGIGARVTIADPMQAPILGLRPQVGGLDQWLVFAESLFPDAKPQTVAERRHLEDTYLAGAVELTVQRSDDSGF